MPEINKSIFFVYNAFIYLNAIELRHKLRLESSNCVLVITTYRKKNIRQLRKIINKGDWRDIYFFFFDGHSIERLDLEEETNSRHGFVKMFILYSRAYKILRSLLETYNQVEFLVNGIYKDPLINHFANSVTFKKYYHLDDGNMTLQVNNQVRVFESSNSFSTFYFRGNWKEMLFFRVVSRLFGLKIKPIRTLTFFTSHEMTKFEYDTYLSNDFLQLKSKIVELPIDNQLVFFLGGPLIEIGICTEHDYHRMIASVIKKYPSTKFVYLPHRFELGVQISKLKLKFNLFTLEPDIPIELYISQVGQLPRTISSFYSSALTNLNVILPNTVDLDAFEIDPTIIIPDNKRIAIGSIYEQYRVYSSNYSRFHFIKFSEYIDD